MKTVIKISNVLHLVEGSRNTICTFETIPIRTYIGSYTRLLQNNVPTKLPDGYYIEIVTGGPSGRVAKICHKTKVESTEPNFVKLEKSLVEAMHTIGWKDLTAFIAKWCDENQPGDTRYTLDYWIDEYHMKHKTKRR